MSITARLEQDSMAYQIKGFLAQAGIFGETEPSVENGEFFITTPEGLRFSVNVRFIRKEEQ